MIVFLIPKNVMETALGRLQLLVWIYEASFWQWVGKFYKKEIKKT